MPVSKYLLIISLLLQANVFAQAPTQQAIRAKIDTYSNNFPQERAYIQFDKPAYSAGETIWFKAYLMNGQDISGLSKTFYVDFTDDDGNLLLHGVYAIWDASAEGNFDIPAAYKSKSVHIRAYTKWMLNFDAAFLYNKDVRIIPKPLQGSKAPTKPALSATVQFFPEGGDLVAGIKSRVAFKANYQNGLPVGITGIVTDSKGNIMDSIKTLHDGMGYIYIDALAGETYTAKWVDEQGTPHQTVLPTVKPFGATIQINPGRLRTGFLIKWSDNLPEALKALHIIATMQQQVVYMAGVSIGESSATGGNIPSAQFPSGIMQVTLFDANWLPLAERITFINNNDYDFKPVLTFDTVGTGKRGKNVMVVDVPDSIVSNLSVSVTDAGLGIDSTDDIISHLLVTGDLKGRVYHPAYYFSNKNDSVAAHLDLVMLTNGWRRFKWEDVTAGKLPLIKYQRDSVYLNFSGDIHGATPKQIQDAGMMMAIISPKGRDSSRQMITIPLNSDGSFSKPGFIFFDTLKVYYQFPGKGGSKLANTAEVTFNSGAVPQVPKAVLDKNNLGYVFTDTTGDYYNSRLALEQARLQELLKSTTLQGVTVKTRVKSKNEIMDEKYTSGMFSGGDARQFDLVNDPFASGMPDVLTYLTGKVAGLNIVGAGSAMPSVTWRGAPTDIYVDEVKADINMATTLNMNDIAYIKVLQPPFFGSFGGGAGGAIAIYTRRGDEVQNNPGVGTWMQYKLVTGYTLPRQFYTPNYDTLNAASMQEDVRSTLYWNPLIITTPKNHILKLPFYNNDVTHQFRVVLEGVSADGRFTRVEKLVN